MISRAYDLSELSFSDDYYSEKIKAEAEAYGMSYDFCRFYHDEGSRGNILLYNSSAVISGSFDDTDELSDFIRMNMPFTAECPPQTAKLLLTENYERKKRLIFRTIPDESFDEKEFERSIDKPPSLEQMYKILSSGFEGLQYDLWYADMSHRIRHGVSEAFMYRSASCAYIDFCTNDKAYISGVATLKSERGRGFASGLMKYIAAVLSHRGIYGYLLCYEELSDFYAGLGFMLEGEDTILIRKDNFNG